jgi:hypothetical protein
MTTPLVQTARPVSCRAKDIAKKNRHAGESRNDDVEFYGVLEGHYAAGAAARV